MKNNSLSHSKYVLFLLITALGWIIYSNSFQGSFKFDDLPFIVNNPAIQNLSRIETIYHFSPTRFVAFVSFAVNYHFHQLDVFGYHLANWTVHILNSLFVWWLVFLTFSTPRMKERYGDDAGKRVALFTALLFLSHPIQTQAVSYIYQRLASLACLFYLLSLCLYIKGRMSAVNGKVMLFYAAALLAAVLGMFTKQNVFTLPVMIIIWEGFFIQPVSRKRNSKNLLYVSMFVIPVLLIIPAIYSFDIRSILFEPRVFERHGTEILTPWIYLLTQFEVIIIYLKLLLFPVGQNFDHHVQLAYHFFQYPTILCFLALCGLFAVGLVVRKKFPAVAFGIIWFFVALSVESSVIPIQNVIWEHRAYLPSVGIFMAIAFLLSNFCSNKNSYQILVISIIGILSVLTYQRNKVWENSVVFWKDVTVKSPFKSRAYHNLGAAYLTEKKYDMASQSLLKAVELDPTFSESYSVLAQIYIDKDRLTDAEQYLLKALELNPESHAALNNLGIVYMRRGELKMAKEFFIEANQTNPGFTQPVLNLADAHIKEGDFSNAVDNYKKLLEVNPHDQESLYRLIKLLLEMKEYDQALSFGKEFIRRHANAEKLTQLGSLFAANNYSNMAVRFFFKALEAENNYPDAYLEMGKVLGNRNDLTGAMEIWREGATLNPEDQRFSEIIRQAGERR